MIGLPFVVYVYERNGPYFDAIKPKTFYNYRILFLFSFFFLVCIFFCAACREKLKQYQEKLAEVEKLLEMDPTNAEVLTLKKDLVEVIELTADLV